MSVEVEELVLLEALEQACAKAAESNRPYAGGVTPAVAWAQVQKGQAEIDAQQHRGGADGWRFHKLPWVQD